MTHKTESLLERLRRHSASGPLPMHMPGHKRNTALADYLAPLGAALDVTEIFGMDDLHEAEEILAESMTRAAALWGSRRCFYLVNGSTCGLLAGIRACTRPGDKILVARNCHKSVYNAIELCGLDPVWFLPPLCPDTGIYGSVAPETVEAALAAHPDVRLVVLTSPSYEGVVSDITAIADLAHSRNIPLLVDEAHGAHLGFHPAFPKSAVQCGADVVVQSLHKTMPCLTQTALLHVQGTPADDAEIARQLAVFETSSPSYLLMASIDGCVQLLQQDADALFAPWAAFLRDFDRQIAPLRHLRVLGHSANAPLPMAFAHDPSKLVLSVRGTSFTGPELMTRLRNDYDIELEMCAPEYGLAMTGPGDTAETLQRLAEALLEIDRSLTSAEALPPPALTLPPRRFGITEAMGMPPRFFPAEEAVGHASAAYIWAYPPGIPLICPGEEITPALLTEMDVFTRSGIRLHSSRSGPAGTLAAADGVCGDFLL